ncbi:alpha/beta fold hydrolase [Kitasatospora sp. NPDC047058]|uniref:alpha/beta fold hydrolase n=1 Tax=Kitasatospora sp. NPDC047058 TaxID=3155620 RepID=UPI0033F9B81D
MGQYVDIDRLEERYWKVFRVEHDAGTREFLGRCQSHTIKVDDRPHKYYECGSGPAVLLVHGVHSNLGSMVPLAQTLLDQGFRVVLFDAPAHGEALGSTTNPLEVRELIRALCGRLGELHAVVGHSLGALWAFAALNGDLRVKALVSISAPARHRYLIEKFAEMHTVDDELIQELSRRIEGLLGEGAWTGYSPQEIVKTVDLPGLVIHGADDDFVPPEHAADLHAGWSGSALELIEGAGHFDVLGSHRVRALVAEYLRKPL